MDINHYPAIKKHLKQFRECLEPKTSDDDKKGRKPGTYKWYEIQDNIAYFEEFRRNKIVFPDIAQASKFTWDTSKSFLGNTAYIIPTDEIWLVGLLNAKAIWWFYQNISSIIQGGFVRFIAQYMEQIPIPTVTTKQKDSIVNRVEKILADPNGSAVPRLEHEIDELVYKLYNLTQKEIAIIEKKK